MMAFLVPPSCVRQLMTPRRWSRTRSTVTRGGECLMVEIPYQEDASFFHPKYTNRLLTMAECHAMDEEIKRVHGEPPNKRCPSCGVPLTDAPVQHKEDCRIGQFVDAEDAPGTAGTAGSGNT